MVWAWCDASLDAAAPPGNPFYSLGVNADGSVAAWAADGNDRGVTIVPPPAQANAFMAVYGRGLNPQSDGAEPLPPP